MNICVATRLATCRIGFQKLLDGINAFAIVHVLFQLSKYRNLPVF